MDYNQLRRSLAFFLALWPDPDMPGIPICHFKSPSECLLPNSREKISFLFHQVGQKRDIFTQKMGVHLTTNTRGPERSLDQIRERIACRPHYRPARLKTSNAMKENDHRPFPRPIYDRGADPWSTWRNRT